MPKWDWMPQRIKDCGYRTYTDFANTIGWRPVRLSELFNERNGSYSVQRKIPADKVAIVAEKLRVSPENLTLYNNDIITTMPMEDCNKPSQGQPQNPKRQLTPEEEDRIISIALTTIQNVLDEQNLEIAPEAQARLLGYALRHQLVDTIGIKSLVSGMLLADSDFFNKINKVER